MTYRANKKYCSDRCRQYGNRNKQNSQNSRGKARENYELFDTARLMADRLYDLPPFEELLSNLVFEDCWSCSDLVRFGCFHSIFERDACDDFGEVVKAA